MEKTVEQRTMQLPAWETPAGFESKSVLPVQSETGEPPAQTISKTPTSGSRGIHSTFMTRLDQILPPHKTYTPAKLKRRTLLLCILAVAIALLALILGLSIGLTTRHKSSADLPLPTGAEVYHGELTYYEPGLGACGITSGDNDDIVAIAHALFDSQSLGSDPNANPLCGRMLRAQRYNSQVGKTVSLDLKVVDRCVGCQPTDLDVSPGAFDQLADPDLGRVNVSWAWL